MMPAYWNAKSKANEVSADELTIQVEDPEGMEYCMIPESHVWWITSTLNYWIDKYRQRQLDLAHHVGSRTYEYIDGGKKKFLNENINRKETKTKTYARNEKQPIIWRNMLLSMMPAEEVYLIRHFNGNLMRVYRFIIDGHDLYIPSPKADSPQNPQNLYFMCREGAEVHQIVLGKGESKKFPKDELCDEENLLSMGVCKTIIKELRISYERHVPIEQMVAFGR